ncbi:ATP-dependent helicase [Candidatus Micrarchaeota archaeon]|nr:ATP-dependent helicase [Candidatus Micrarchaeota archaeon]
MAVDYEKELNSEQRAVVQNGDGVSLVVAGPGSGKTRVLIYRLCHIMESGQKPENILLLTFTNKAAKEMINRAEHLIGPDARKITAGTFHHFANMILRRHGRTVGIENNFTILDEQDSLSLLLRILRKFDEKAKKSQASPISRIISLSKIKMCSLSDVIRSDRELSYLERHLVQIEEISSLYGKIKRENGAVDFDDLLYFCHIILRDNKLVREHYQNYYRHLLVDEFQDSDRVQEDTISLLHGKGDNLMVVGDDAQSIYSFRGAEISNMLNFKDKYRAKVFFLSNNYRSHSLIVDVINYCIKNSQQKIDKKLLATKAPGLHPVILESNDPHEETMRILELVETRLKTGKKIGILFRSVYLCSELEVELSKRGIDYDLRGGVKFFEQAHIKDLLSLVRAYENPRDSSALLRLFTLFPGIGEKRVMDMIDSISSRADIISAIRKLDKKGLASGLVEKLFASQEATPANAARMIDDFYSGFYSTYLEETFDDSTDRKPDVDALISAATRFESTTEFLSSFALSTEHPKHKNCDVILSTIHQAKGLEWDVVFVIGLSEGALPSSRSQDVEEERRLFYVAISRAKEELFMSFCRQSGRFYGMEEQFPSRFLDELPSDSYKRADF